MSNYMPQMAYVDLSAGRLMRWCRYLSCDGLLKEIQVGVVGDKIDINDQIGLGPPR